MSRTLDDFVGSYVIRHGQGAFDIVKRGYRLLIGTDKDGGGYGDMPPDGIKVGVAIINQSTGERVLPAPGNPPAYAYLVEGSLNGSTYWLGDQQLPVLLAYQVSLMTLTKSDGTIYKAPSIMIVLGDPENAGVWGADDESGG